MKRMLLRAALAVGVALVILAASAPSWAYRPGDAVDVLWKGTWYPASVLRVKGNQSFIHYDGYDNSWDEWVGPNRIRPRHGANTYGFEEGDPVMVLWKGTWYDAHVLRSKGNQYFIHYDGYDNSWDEWVGPNRIRAR